MIRPRPQGMTFCLCFVHPALALSLGHDTPTDSPNLSVNAPSVLNRLKKLGFGNLKTADSDAGAVLTNGFAVKSYVDPTRSLDDATYTIDTGSGFVVHCNDNWFEFEPKALSSIAKDRARYSNQNIAFFSQTNSASGHPLSYKCFDDQQKISILRSKVKGMVVQGMKNADALGIEFILFLRRLCVDLRQGIPVLSRPCPGPDGQVHPG